MAQVESASWQVIVVTHNPNLAVVCDAEQIVHASCDKAASRFEHEAGAIERPETKDRAVQILEGTEPAFKNRSSKYRLLQERHGPLRQGGRKAALVTR